MHDSYHKQCSHAAVTSWHIVRNSQFFEEYNRDYSTIKMIWIMMLLNLSLERNDPPTKVEAPRPVGRPCLSPLRKQVALAFIIEWVSTE
ncbi:hypothetical protein TNCV_1094431 [Trichonephila clavipes]|uniref:Uncharacterized protein n=1 Tax=Trichonephila clavipes TaxID=2585209 RepID=A0A8X6REF7_TRICX|nr:hypothetical protein TNCV_1094431 [Trichonephila clavipes]